MLDRKIVGMTHTKCEAGSTLYELSQKSSGVGERGGGLFKRKKLRSMRVGTRSVKFLFRLRKNIGEGKLIDVIHKAGRNLDTILLVV